MVVMTMTRGIDPHLINLRNMRSDMPAVPDRPPLWRRLTALPNPVALVVAVALFVVGITVFDTNLGALISATVAAVAGASVWLVWAMLTRPVDLRDAVRGWRRLGTVPDVPGTPAPTLIDPWSEPSLAYRSIVSDLEAHTNGQVVLVTSPAPGQGTTTVTMNLAVSATQAGRRVFLIDGDIAGRGLSRYMGSGSVPGLTDLAAGDVSLGDAARMWQLDARTSMPVMPAGSDREDAPQLFAGSGLANAIDRVTERADLVLIDSPPVLWNGTSGPLAAHADGSVLVLTERAQVDAVERSKAKLEAAGAPVLGYVVNRSKGAPLGHRPWLGAIGRMVGLFLVLVLGFGIYTGTRVWASWSGVERGELDTARAREAITQLPVVDIDAVADDEISSEDYESNIISVPAFDGPYRSFLIIGGDEVAGAADVIMLMVLPNDTGRPFMVSLPRDLYLKNPCTGGFSRINATIHGCDSVNGETNLALTVEEFTGISVQHFAKFDFAGFERIIDAVGGVEICVEYAVRDSRAQLSLPAGCINASGEQALAWVRSRHTEQQVNGSWRSVPGAGDLLRNQHQQEVLVELFKKLKSFDSPSDFAAKVNSLTNAFTLDDRLGIGDAIGLAWSARDLDLDDILRLELDVKLSSTEKGQSVLISRQPFDELLREENPEFAAAIYEAPIASSEENRPGTG
jgi:LCP family protein required for cell wall assembly